MVFKRPSPFVTRDMLSSSFNRSYDYNIHLYNHTIRIKTLCVLLLCCLLSFHCLPMNKTFPLIFAQNNTHTQGIVVTDRKQSSFACYDTFHGVQKHINAKVTHKGRKYLLAPPPLHLYYSPYLIPPSPPPPPPPLEVRFFNKSLPPLMVRIIC